MALVRLTSLLLESFDLFRDVPIRRIQLQRLLKMPEGLGGLPEHPVPVSQALVGRG